MAHKYVASLPAVGGAAPPSRSEVWYYGAAVLLWRSDVQEWYYPALREGITHVTIDSHNVARTVVELKKDDKAARRMAIEARNVHENGPRPRHWAGLKFFNVYGPNEYHKGGQISVALKNFSEISEWI